MGLRHLRGPQFAGAAEKVREIGSDLRQAEIHQRQKASQEPDLNPPTVIGQESGALAVMFRTKYRSDMVSVAFVPV